MINIDKLDKRKTYIVLEYGTSAVSKLIQKLTKDYYPKAKKIPSHVLALVYEDKVWRIYESHMKAEDEFGIPSGVRTYQYDIFQEAFPNTNKYGVVYPCRFNKKRLKDLLGQPYGMGDIAALLRVGITKKNGTQKDRKGYICSEYLAVCCAKIRRYLKLKSHCITPIHWLKYLEENNIKPIL